MQFNNFYLNLQKRNPLNLCTYFPIDPRKYELILQDEKLVFIKREIELEIPHLFEPSCLRCVTMYFTKKYIPHISKKHEEIVIHENAYFLKVLLKQEMKKLIVPSRSFSLEKEEEEKEPKQLKAHINAVENEKNKKIKDLIVGPHPLNENFSKGKFYSFCIDIRNSDGYIRANSVRENSKNLKGNEKALYYWKQNKKTQEFINALSEYLNISPDDLVITINYTCNELRGVYIHPELIIEYASWISVDFKIYTHKIVLEFFSREAKKKLEDQLRKSEIELQEKNIIIIEKECSINELKKSVNELKESNKRLEHTVNKTYDKLSNMQLYVEGRVKRLTVDVPKKYTHIFIIWKINPNRGSYLYQNLIDKRDNCYTMARVMYTGVNSTKTTREKDYNAKLESVYEIQFANPIELVNEIVKINGIKRFHSFIELFISEQEFLSEVQKIVNRDISDYVSIKN